jgi:hypothetical protein
MIQQSSACKREIVYLCSPIHLKCSIQRYSRGSLICISRGEMALAKSLGLCWMTRCNKKVSWGRTVQRLLNTGCACYIFPYQTWEEILFLFGLTNREVLRQTVMEGWWWWWWWWWWWYWSLGIGSLTWVRRRFRSIVFHIIKKLLHFFRHKRWWSD